MIDEIRNGIIRGLKKTSSVRVAMSTQNMSMDVYVNTLDGTPPKGAGVYVVDDVGDVYIISIDKAKDKTKR